MSAGGRIPAAWNRFPSFIERPEALLHGDQGATTLGGEDAHDGQTTDQTDTGKAFASAGLARRGSCGYPGSIGAWKTPEEFEGQQDPSPAVRWRKPRAGRVIRDCRASTWIREVAGVIHPVSLEQCFFRIPPTMI